MTRPALQRRTLVRARGLGAFRRALVDLVLSGAAVDARRRVVIVPTRASAELLRQTVERAAAARGRPAIIVPDLLTRDEWMSRLHAEMPDGGPLLSRADREVLLGRAARETRVRHPLGGALFDLRPGLVGAMLDFYDELRRRQRTVRRAVRALFAELRVERGSDRGSEHLIHQTCFLGFTFLAYERLRHGSGGVDEHVVRAALLAQQMTLSFDHLIIAVADHPSDPRGLWPADFDLAGRLRAIAAIDVVVTDEAHDAGFRDRLEQQLPGIEEQRAADVPGTPRLVRPLGVEASHAPVRTCRDREEELRQVARVVRADAERTAGTLSASAAVVFQRPLPYLYLAQQILSDARVPYQAFDALPLAAEPYAALLDLVLAFAGTGGTRETTVALLRSTLLQIAIDGIAVSGADVSALDAVLTERRATGGALTYGAEVEAHAGQSGVRHRSSEAPARRAAAAAAEVYRTLAPFREGAGASAQVGALTACLRTYERTPRGTDTWRERHLRARAAVLSVLDELAAACGRYDNGVRDPDALAAAIHHAIEARTFTPRRGAAGVHLVDAVGARFGDFDHVHLVGLVETDWPERLKRGIFYSAGLLKALGWPQEPDHMRAEQAAFRDLMGLAADTTRLSAFEFEGDSIVTVSPMVEMVRDMPTTDDGLAAGRPIFADETMVYDLPPPGLDADPAEWLAVRHRRPPYTSRAYAGFVDAQPPRAYRVSRVDRYVDCPFKYFSESVLALPEERDEAMGLTPIERGTLLHQLFETFYQRWRDGGHDAITPATLPDALALFAAIAHHALDALPPADRALEATRLLGSLVGTGVAERVFELEADSGAPVLTRWLEQELNGPFTFPVSVGWSERAIEIRGKADRIDVLGDGSLRVIDYKLGRMPDLKSSVQIAVYAHCASQWLEAADGAPHPVASAMYLAFGDDRSLQGSIGGASESMSEVVRTRASSFEATVTQIEAGEFPPRPKRPADCQWCAYAGVCRKEYMAEDDEATDAV